jgi:hypothetical protein
MNHQLGSGRMPFFANLRPQRTRTWWKNTLFFRVTAAKVAIAAFLALSISETADSAAASFAFENLCDEAALNAASAENVPLDVLQAISRTETGQGKNLNPWPWTVNMEGEGRWFKTRDQAMAYVFSHFKKGARSFDLGCFQINYKWHGSAFRTIDEMFDPEINARYAARFLHKLHDELGDWSLAAGAYHSRSGPLAKRYSARFDQIRANISQEQNRNDTPEAVTAGLISPRSKPQFKPLIGIGTTELGSLVPVTRRPLEPLRPIVAFE